MSPQQAIELIDRAIQAVNTTREGHIALQKAVAVINDLVKAKEEKKGK